MNRRPGGWSARVRRLRLWTFVGGLGLLLAACRQALPQNSLAPAGPPAREIDSLFTLVFWIAAGVFFLVEGALVFALIRYRARPGAPAPRQTHGHTRLEVVWTIIPALLLLGVAVPTVGTIFSLSKRPAGAMKVHVVGHQWWWEFRYPDEGVVTANELHIPAGVPVTLDMTVEEKSAIPAAKNGKPLVEAPPVPVIHSFWVPRLAGKQDLIPGEQTELTIEADHPGTYLGQCAEFCGLSHALMRFRVVVQDQAGFDAWIAAEKQPAATAPPDTLAAEGEALFENGFTTARGQFTCLACHTTDPTQAGTVGPNLAHFAGRDTLASGVLQRNAADIARWLENPAAVKPGAVMPDYGLSPEQIRALVAYLQTLK